MISCTIHFPQRKKLNQTALSRWDLLLATSPSPPKKEEKKRSGCFCHDTSAFLIRKACFTHSDFQRQKVRQTFFSSDRTKYLFTKNSLKSFVNQGIFCNFSSIK